MRFRRLGRTGLQVSEIGFGSLEIGRDWGVVPTDRGTPQEANSIQLLEAAITLGVNFVDTAMAYVKSEERIGKAISSGRVRRERFYLATKAGERFDEATGSLYDYSYAGITRSIMESLEHLQVDRVEGLQLHTAPLEVVRMGMRFAPFTTSGEPDGASSSAPASPTSRPAQRQSNLGTTTRFRSPTICWSGRLPSASWS